MQIIQIEITLSVIGIFVWDKALKIFSRICMFYRKGPAVKKLKYFEKWIFKNFFPKIYKYPQIKTNVFSPYLQPNIHLLEVSLDPSSQHTFNSWTTML